MAVAPPIFTTYGVSLALPGHGRTPNQRLNLLQLPQSLINCLLESFGLVYLVSEIVILRQISSSSPGTDTSFSFDANSATTGILFHPAQRTIPAVTVLI